MKLNHLNLTVTDVDAAQAFLSTYFGLEDIGRNKHMAFLKDDNGAVIALTSAVMAKETEVRYPGGFHIGFIQPSEAMVDEINARLKADGFDVPPPSRMHRSWTFYMQAPGGFTVEVLC
ncbi:VOC family protein [Chloroflexia bacterium SDU3-3]|nr:VOC family protein [Chloroflexia bacterium SDU3-3]